MDEVDRLIATMDRHAEERNRMHKEALQQYDDANAESKESSRTLIIVMYSRLAVEFLILVCLVALAF